MYLLRGPAYLRRLALPCINILGLVLKDFGESGSHEHRASSIFMKIQIYEVM